MFLSKHSNGIYYLWFRDGAGKRQKVSTRCRLKMDAYKFVQMFKRDEYLRRKQVKHKLLSDVIKDYLNVVEANLVKGTVKNYRSALNNLQVFTGDIPLISFTPYHFDAFKSERLKSIRPVSLNIELRALRTFFNTAVRWRLLERTPFEVKLVKIPETQPTFLTREEFQKLLSIIEEGWFKEVIVFAVCTGLRRAELINLRWDCVDFQRKIIRIESSQFFRGNPVFRMCRAARMLDAVLFQEFTPHLKASDVAGAAGRDVPVAGNLHGVFFRQHRIKDRLFRKPWRERPHSALSDQFELARADRPPKCHDVISLVRHAHPRRFAFTAIESSVRWAIADASDACLRMSSAAVPS